MKKRLQTIYEYFSDYTQEEINRMIKMLTGEDRALLAMRYGADLHNPQTSEEWDILKKDKFYGTLIPKMKRLLAKGINEENVQSIEVKNENIDNTAQLLELLKSEKENHEICEKLKISPQQLYEDLLKLKTRGIPQTRKYYSDGSIRYKNVSNIEKMIQLKQFIENKTIITDMKENNLKILVISDLHFGNELERLDLINRAYNYCAKNDIHIILCGGDFIDGTFAKGNQKIADPYQQMEYFIKNYPYDKSILTFGVAGDHDISLLEKAYIDIIEVCNNFRHDIIIGGYSNTSINIKNDKIHLYHSKFQYGKYIKISETDAPIILHGHSHKYLTEIKNNALNITLPSLSGILHLMPSALEMNLYFDKGYIVNSVIKHLYFGKQDIVLGESRFNLLKGRNLNYGNISNVESLNDNSEPGKVLKKEPENLSQIEKFNRRYNESR